MAGYPIPMMCICGHSFAVPANRAGTRVPCPSCARVLAVPAARKTEARARVRAKPVMEPDYGNPQYQLEEEVPTRVSHSNRPEFPSHQGYVHPARRSRVMKKRKHVSPLMPVFTLALFFLILAGVVFVVMKLNTEFPIGHSINVVTHIDPSTNQLKMAGHNLLYEGRDMSLAEGAVLIIEMHAVNLNGVEYQRGAVLVVFNENPLQLRYASPLDKIILQSPLTFAGDVLQAGYLPLRPDGYLQGTDTSPRATASRN